jgi:hypothetical protein
MDCTDSIRSPLIAEPAETVQPQLMVGTGCSASNEGEAHQHTLPVTVTGITNCLTHLQAGNQDQSEKFQTQEQDLFHVGDDSEDFSLCARALSAETGSFSLQEAYAQQFEGRPPRLSRRAILRKARIELKESHKLATAAHSAQQLANAAVSCERGARRPQGVCPFYFMTGMCALINHENIL